MGAGDCADDAESQLLRQAMELNLGFSESQLCSAIRYLVKGYGSTKEASAWIPCDNFTVLVNCILDNPDLECQQSRSPGCLEEMGNAPLSSVQGKETHIQERRKGGKPPPHTKEELPNGFQSDGKAPVKMDFSGEKVEQQNSLSTPQKCRLDRKAMHLHYKNILSSNSIKVLSKGSTNSQVSEAQTLSTQPEQTNSRNSLAPSFPNKKSISLVEQAEHVSQMIPKAAPLQRTNPVAKNEDPKTSKKRGQDLDGFMRAPYTTQKKGRIPQPETRKGLVGDARTSMPSGCGEDFVTGHRSSQIARNKSGGSKSFMGRLPGHDDWSQIGLVVEQSRETKAVVDGYGAAYEKPRVLVNMDEAEVPSTSSGFKSKDTGGTVREAGPCTAEIPSSSNDGQKASCSVLDGGVTKEVQLDSAAEGSWLGQLEAFLKEGNCQRALEVLKAQKKKGKHVGTGQTEESHLEGRGDEVLPDIPGKKRGFVVSYDISRGLEKLPISCVNEYNTDILPDNFLYLTRSVIRQAAHVDTSFSRIGDLHCCCSDDCLRSSEACKCTDSTRGEYAYDRNGQLIERLATSFQSGCTTRNGDFITECCDKCRCSMNCGNRVVQRGITRKLQVFRTPTRKGWGVRALEKIPARSFVFEYLGEIATNLEQYERNLEYAQNGVYTYTMCLDADHDMERKHFKDGLSDDEALVLDATIFGNVSRFVNHRCNDANLFMRPVQIETRDTHYYHAAFFAAWDIQEMEELTWDYGIDFEDKTHVLKAFRCCCKSSFCRDKESLFNQEKTRRGKSMKTSRSKPNFKDSSCG